MRTRQIRPGIVTNEVLAALGPYATLLFERLWMLADREGRLQDRSARIKAQVFPYWPDVPVEKLLAELCAAGLIVRYKGLDSSGFSVAYIAIPNFLKHQHIHPHEVSSVIPPPPTPSKDTEPRHVITSNGAAVTSDTNVITCRSVPSLPSLPSQPSDQFLPLENEKGGENLPLPPPSDFQLQNRYCGFYVFRDCWPEHNRTGEDDASRLWISQVDAKIIKPEGTEVLEGLERWKKSDAWMEDAGKYIPSMAKFLRERRWKDHPKPYTGPPKSRFEQMMDDIANDR